MAVKIPIPRKVRIVTIKAEIRIPEMIKGKDLYIGIRKRKAAAAPVHAPVKGNGMATKKTNAMAPYLAYLPSNLCFVFSKKWSKYFFPHFDLFSANL